MSEQPRQRPNEEAIPYVPRPEQTERRGSKESFIYMFRDLLEGFQDMPEEHMRPEDYTSKADEGNTVKMDRALALRRNKRNVAWFSAVTSSAELVTNFFTFDDATRQQIDELSTSLRTSVDAKELTTDAMVSMGDTVCHLVIQALERLPDDGSAVQGGAV